MEDEKVPVGIIYFHFNPLTPTRPLLINLQTLKTRKFLAEQIESK